MPLYLCDVVRRVSRANPLFLSGYLKQRINSLRARASTGTHLFVNIKIWFPRLNVISSAKLEISEWSVSQSRWEPYLSGNRLSGTCNIKIFISYTCAILGHTTLSRQLEIEIYTHFNSNKIFIAEIYVGNVLYIIY